MEYAIGLKEGDIEGCNVSVELPDFGWCVANGRTDELKELYDEIYKDGALDLEIETFFENGDCTVEYYRKGWRNDGK